MKNAMLIGTQNKESFFLPTNNLKKISPNLKWINIVSAGVEHLLPLNWMFDDLILTNSSGAHAKKAGEFGLMSILMLQNQMTKIVTNQKNKEFVTLLSKPIEGFKVKALAVRSNLFLMSFCSFIS